MNAVHTEGLTQRKGVSTTVWILQIKTTWVTQTAVNMPFVCASFPELAQCFASNHSSLSDNRHRTVHSSSLIAAPIKP